MLKNKIPAMSQGSLEYLWKACAIKKNKKTFWFEPISCIAVIRRRGFIHINDSMLIYAI